MRARKRLLREKPASDVEAGDDLFRRETARGLARVICYDPRHDMRLARLPASRADALLACFQAQIRECREREEIEGILVFENDGEAVGVSNPHPHGQVYGLGFHPADFARELAACEAHLERTGRALMDEIVERELEEGVRLVARNEGAVAFVPFFARFAYETYVVPRTPAQSLADLDATERAAVASLWHDLSVRFDALWGRPFPNIMTLHEPPTDGRAHPAWRSFLGFAPPLRAPGLKKHLAGPEVGAGTFIADTWPEEKAAELRAAVAGPPSDEP